MWRFAPDVDPTTPEIYTDMARMEPTPWGTYKSALAITADTGNTSTNQPVDSEIFIKLAGTTRWVAGTSSKLYDSTDLGATFTDRTPGGLATSGGDTRWCFATFGDVVIACQIADVPQASSSGAFADLGGSPPKAALVTVVANAVILANYDDGSAVKDGWFASDVGDHTNWSTGESASGRLLDTPGPITCLFPFRGRAYACKNAGLYEGQYVGGEVKWSWRLVHPLIGAAIHTAWASNGDYVLLYSTSGVYLFDGVSFRRIDDGLEDWLRTNFAASVVNVQYNHSLKCFFVYSGINYAAYCPESNLWSSSAMYDEAGAYTPSTVARVNARTSSMSRFPYGFALKASDSSYYAFVQATAQYYAHPSSVTTGWIGGDSQVTFIAEVEPLLVPGGTNAVNTSFPPRLTHKTAMQRWAGMATITGSPSSLNSTTGRFDTTAGARWHEFKVADTAGTGTALANPGGMEIAGVVPIFKRAGKN